jgi:hypothetical protein
MAEPFAGVSLLEGLRRDQRHMADIVKTLEELSERFERHGIPYAVIGAIAMRYHNFKRYTEDIDLLTTPEGLDKIHEKLVGRGLVPRAPGLRKGLKHAANKVLIDLIQSGEHVGSKKSPLLYPSPHSEKFESIDGLRVPTLPTLMEFKLASGTWGKRLKDHVDVQELIKANKLDESFAEKILEELRPKFLELLEMTEEEVDPETGL